MNDGSGMKCVEFARYSDQRGCWLKTSGDCSQRMLDGSSEEWCETWPRSGIVSNGIAYRRPPLVPRISGIGRSFWPTPTATDYKGCSDNWHKNRGKRKSPMEYAQQEIWKEGGTILSGPKLRASYLRAATHPNDGKGSSYPHPSFVEWLMGFPIGWTELDALETQ